MAWGIPGCLLAISLLEQTLRERLVEVLGPSLPLTAVLGGWLVVAVCFSLRVALPAGRRWTGLVAAVGVLGGLVAAVVLIGGSGESVLGAVEHGAFLLYLLFAWSLYGWLVLVAGVAFYAAGARARAR